MPLPLVASLADLAAARPCEASTPKESSLAKHGFTLTLIPQWRRSRRTLRNRRLQPPWFPVSCVTDDRIPGVGPSLSLERPHGDDGRLENLAMVPKELLPSLSPSARGKGDSCCFFFALSMRARGWPLCTMLYSHVEQELCATSHNTPQISQTCSDCTVPFPQLTSKLWQGAAFAAGGSSGERLVSAAGVPSSRPEIQLLNSMNATVLCSVLSCWDQLASNHCEDILTY